MTVRSAPGDLPTASADSSVVAIVVGVLVFLGIPLAAGYLTRTLGERAKGRDGYEQRLLPRLGPWALYGLLFTIVLLFALQGGAITSAPGDVARIALPLLACFVVMFWGSFALGRVIGLDHARTTTLSFTAASNHVELAIAVAIGTSATRAGTSLNDQSVASLAEVGVDIPTARTHQLTEDDVRAADLVVVLG